MGSKDIKDIKDINDAETIDLAHRLTIADGLDCGGYAWEPITTLHDDRHVTSHSMIAIDSYDLCDCGYADIDGSPDKGIWLFGTVIAIPTVCGADILADVIPCSDGISAYIGTDVRGQLYDRDVPCICEEGRWREDDDSPWQKCDRCEGDGYVDGPAIYWRLYLHKDDDDYTETVEHIVTRAWALVWADQYEAIGHSLSGQDILEACPDVPDAIVASAGKALETRRYDILRLSLIDPDDDPNEEYLAWDTRTLPDAITMAIYSALDPIRANIVPDDSIWYTSEDEKAIAEMLRTSKHDGPLSRQILAALLVDPDDGLDIEALYRIDILACNALENGSDGALQIANYLMCACGIECFYDAGKGYRFRYVNVGDTYDTTFIQFTDTSYLVPDVTTPDGVETFYKGRILISSWGDIVEGIDAHRALHSDDDDDNDDDDDDDNDDEVDNCIDADDDDDTDDDNGEE